jgi:hypothetical protein
VSTSTLTIGELGGTSPTATPIAGFTVTPVDATDFKIALPATYQPKYGQKYEIRATPGITSGGKALSAEGCNTSDCSDVKSFTTRRVSVQIAADPNDAAPTGFTVNFSDPIDPASITPFLTDATANPPKAGEFKLFARDANGALATTSTPIKCVITDPVTVTCTAISSLGTAPASFLASAVFLPTATQDSTQGGPSGPAIVDASVSKDPSARFSGNASGSVFGACPAP